MSSKKDKKLLYLTKPSKTLLLPKGSKDVILTPEKTKAMPPKSIIEYTQHNLLLYNRSLNFRCISVITHKNKSKLIYQLQTFNFILNFLILLN